MAIALLAALGTLATFYLAASREWVTRAEAQTMAAQQNAALAEKLTDVDRRLARVEGKVDQLLERRH